MGSDTKKKSIWPKKCYAQKYSNIALASSYVKIHEKTFSVKYKIQINFSIWTLRNAFHVSIHNFWGQCLTGFNKRENK